MKRIIALLIVLSFTTLFISCEQKLPEYPGLTTTVEVGTETEAILTEGTANTYNGSTYSKDENVMIVGDKSLSLLDFLLDLKALTILNSVEYMEYMLTSALDLYSDILLIERLAEQFNITIDDEGLSEVEAEISELIDTEALSVIELGLVYPFWKRLYTSLYLYEQVGDALLNSRDYVFDEAEFEEDFEDFLENCKGDYLRIDYSYILLDSEEDAKTLKSQLDMGIQLEQILTEDYKLKSFLNFPYLYINYQILDELGLFTNEELDLLTLLDVDDLSPIFKTSEGFVFFFTEAKVNLTLEEIREICLDLYMTSQRNTAFKAELETLERDKIYQVNRNLLDNLDLGELISSFDPYTLFTDLK